MRKLLPLLPALALASCSSGHDLKSNKPFRMTCSAEGVQDRLIVLVSPELPQATGLRPGSETLPEETLQVIVKSPIRFELQGFGRTYAINRETGEVTTAYGGWEEGGRTYRKNRFNFEPLPEEVECIFETL